MAIRYKIQIAGKVQGVWFRKSTLQEATQLGLSGFVCNKPDNSVYLEAEGDPAALKTLLQWCQDGPTAARVDSVNWEEIPVISSSSFVIKYL